MSDFGLHELRDSALSYNPEFVADKIDSDSIHGDATSGGSGDDHKFNGADPEVGFSIDSEMFKLLWTAPELLRMDNRTKTTIRVQYHFIIIPYHLQRLKNELAEQRKRGDEYKEKVIYKFLSQKNI